MWSHIHHMHSGKLEFLALKWAICERFRDYLYYAPHFMVYINNNSLTYILSAAKLNATDHRWVAQLADFNISIKYRPGKHNADVDVFSRMPLDINELMEQCTVEVSQEVISASVHGVIVQKNIPPAWVMTAHINALDLVSDACSPALEKAKRETLSFVKFCSTKGTTSTLPESLLKLNLQM